MLLKNRLKYIDLQFGERGRRFRILVLKYPILAIILHLISQRHNIVHFKVWIISICEVKMINSQVDFNPKLLIKKDFFCQQ
jgi:hypothetical protein